jgi:hypothetical protein
VAERSTAAVDVANESGPRPLTADTGGATVDGATAQNETQDSQQADPKQAMPTTTSEAESPEFHSGHKLAHRYRLEECLTRVDGFSSWRAVDEKLRRAVGVHLLPSEHPRARRVLAAARSAALLGDPRFVQVLDAVEEDDAVYVVHEWLPDACALAPLLASGPLAPHEAYELVSQVSQAMATAHREGLAHLRLNPSSVLRTESGQYRIRGLAVAAALRGIESDRPKRNDTGAIGALLYAALTKRWPYPQGAYGLAGLPKDLGLVAPEQVRAGVHRGLSDLAMRALVNDGATPSRQDPPCTTPEELAEAVAEIPRIRHPEPDVPAFPLGAYRQPAARPAQPGAPHTASEAPAPPPALPGKTGKVLKWGVAGLLIAALGLGSWQVADTLMSGQDPPTPSTQEQPQKANAGGTGAVKPLRISGAQEYAPFGDPQHPDQVGSTYDHNGSTNWLTHTFDTGPVLAPYKQGVGIVYDLGSSQTVRSATINLRYGGPYTAVSLYAAKSLNPAVGPSQLRRLAMTQTSDTTAQLSVKDPVPTRYVVVWITAVPKSSEDASAFAGAGYKQAITELAFGG